MSLPPLYAAWMDQLLRGPIPEETEATCDKCVMCPSQSEPQTPSRIRFNPRIKCCTYLPSLPNFLVGRILTSEDPSEAKGRATVEARLAQGAAVTPLGAGVPKSYSRSYQDSAKFEFGRNADLKCPHYLEDEGGRCGIWRHRQSMCAVWFCKHVRGATGMQFWRQAIHPLLSAAETGLAQWCVLQLDIGTDSIRHLFESPNNSQPSHFDREPCRLCWGKWFRREREFFASCAELVRPLQWADVVDVCGPKIRLFARVALELYARLTSEEVPDSLRPAPYQVIERGPDITRLASYSPYDPLDAPNRLLDLLHHFDGRPTAAVIREISEQEDLDLEPELVRRLADFQILKSGSEPPQP
jgi:hypothetical protein